MRNVLIICFSHTTSIVLYFAISLAQEYVHAVDYPRLVVDFPQPNILVTMSDHANLEAGFVDKLHSQNAEVADLPKDNFLVFDYVNDLSFEFIQSNYHHILLFINLQILYLFEFCFEINYLLLLDYVPHT